MGNLVVRERTAEPSLRDLSYVIFRHKRKAAWFFVAVIALATLVTLLLPDVYQSEAKLLVRLGRESVTLDPTATTGQIAQVSTRREAEIKSELEILRSRDLAEKVVDALGPEKVAPHSSLGWFSVSDPDPAKERDRAVRHLMKKWDIEVQRESNIITISYEAGNPAVAQEIIAKLVEFYLEKHLTVNRTPGSHDFFKQQTDQLQAALTAAERELAEAKNKTGLASPAEQRRILLERIGFLQKDLDQSQTDMQASANKIKAMREMLAKLRPTMVTGTTTGFPNVAADGMRQKLYDLQLKEQELLSKYTEKNFLVQEIRRQIKDAKALLDKESPTRSQVTTGLNMTHEQVRLALANEEGLLAGLQAKADKLTSHLAAAQGELRLLNQNEIQLAHLQRKLELNELNYKKYSEKMEQARIDEALETQKISNISVVQAATLPLKPVRPHKGLNLAVGFLFACLGAVGLAFAAERMDHSFKRPEDVERMLGLPVLATIPQLTEDSIPANSRGETLPVLLQTNQPASCGQMGQVGEIYASLCDRLIRQATPGTPFIIGVTSCQQGEGVSTVGANLALALSRKPNQRVLLVDANILHPAASAIFGNNLTHGLMDLVTGERSDFTQVKFAHSGNLDVIASGRGGLTLSQLAESQEFSELLDLWKTEYSFVVFDLPPINSQAILRLAGLAEGILLVVEAEVVRWEAAQRAIKWLSQGEAQVLGVVLNKRLYHIPEWLYRRI